MLLPAGSRAGVIVDFDGTLSPIVDSPGNAFPADGAAELLSSLARRLALVAVLSGRTLPDLRARFEPSGVVLCGSYGRERSDRPSAPVSVRRVGEVVAAARDRLGSVEGVLVEPKGTGVALHYRLAPERERDVEHVAVELARLHGMQIRRGRRVAELTLPGPGKGDAVETLARDYELESLLVAGDDAADLDAFAAARELEVRAVVCVAVSSPEAPPELVALADLVVDGPDDLLVLLRLL